MVSPVSQHRGHLTGPRKKACSDNVILFYISLAEFTPLKYWSKSTGIAKTLLPALEIRQHVCGNPLQGGMGPLNRFQWIRQEERAGVGQEAPEQHERTVAAILFCRLQQQAWRGYAAVPRPTPSTGSGFHLPNPMQGSCTESGYSDFIIIYDYLLSTHNMPGMVQETNTQNPIPKMETIRLCTGILKFTQIKDFCLLGC